MIAQNLDIAKNLIEKWKKLEKKIVFTNGCFDIVHRGHIEYLSDAKKYGTKLVVAINSDSSIQTIKGKSRPIQNEKDLKNFFQKNLFDNELVLCMGAGSISKWIREMEL